MAGAGGKIIRVALQFLRRTRRRARRPASFRPAPRGAPAGVRRLPSGRMPANYRWAGRVYDGPEWTPRLKSRYPNGVRFTNDGFPDFSPYARPGSTVQFQPRFRGDVADEALANRRIGLTRTPDGYTWHHHQDTQTMMLVPTDLHRGVRHAGGASFLEGF
jgi:filamentous hemagglutinin